MTILRINNMKLNTCIGWFKGNPPVVFKLELFSVIEDFPKGWLSIIIFSLSIWKFEISLLLDKS